ncbi:MAG TPA: 3-phosphoshikimate 1-carboxyvinyltransferase [Fusibacter sp.]|nr:3-phosphoshikimate 1-carboxyvinyltransferase [Fusibacter sp.]
MQTQNYDVSITPSKLSGGVIAPPSKSMSHRAVICAGLSESPSILDNIAFSEDIIATLEAMKQFGAEITKLTNNSLRIANPSLKTRISHKSAATEIVIDCNESGSTARFLIPLFHLSNGPVVYKGSARLSQRPFQPYYTIFDKQKINYEAKNDGLPLTIEGSLKPDQFTLVGNISSQFISGLMFVLPLLGGASSLTIVPPLESKDYIELTTACLRAFGIDIEKRSQLEYHINGNQKYQGCNMTIEGDYSQAAFWLVASRIGNDVHVTGLDEHSKQADRAILKVLSRSDMSDPIDVSQCPDLVPILAVLCALTPGTSNIINAGRLRFKESDRLKAIATELNKMGARITEHDDGLTVVGVEKLRGSVVNAWNDHRIAMALAIAATRAEGVTKICGAECIRKSYPEFWAVYQSLGGHINVE